MANKIILDLMHKHQLGDDFIIEYQEANILPYESITIEKLANFFSRKRGHKLNITLLGYTPEVIENINSFYNELHKLKITTI